MFDLKDAYTDIGVHDILNKVSEYDIWKKYCTNFDEIDQPFLSDLYNDRNPACRIKYNRNGRLVYKDFGESSHSFDCFGYIQEKFKCTFNEALKIVYSDFKLGSIRIDVPHQLILNSSPESFKIAKSYIEIVEQPFTSTDYDYWSQYKIPLDKLIEYDVVSCKTVYLHTKKGNILRYDYSRKNPIYAYKFIENGEVSYKIYFPLADKDHKWLNTASSLVIQGYKQLPENGDYIIITKSLKDCICYNLIGYPAISLQGETNKLTYDRVLKILKRFNKIVVNYDYDDEGIKGSKRLNEQYGFNYFFIDDYKDLSDYLKHNSLLKAKRMINKKIKELYE